MPTQRLSPQTWLTAGLEALAKRGPQALAAEPLARALGTTKGSFYWHFQDVPAYHSALLTQWQAAALRGVIELLNEQGAADQRLRQFGHDLLTNRVEAALRVWAQNNSNVAQTLAEVDQQRLDYVMHLLRQLGLANPDFARAILACLTGLPQVSPGDLDTQKATFDTLVDTVLALS